MTLAAIFARTAPANGSASRGTRETSSAEVVVAGGMRLGQSTLRPRAARYARDMEGHPVRRGAERLRRAAGVWISLVLAVTVAPLGCGTTNESSPEAGARDGSLDANRGAAPVDGGSSRDGGSDAGTPTQAERAAFDDFVELTRLELDAGGTPGASVA